MKLTPASIRRFIAERFSLHEDSAHENEIIDSISRNIEFKGSNLWALIFAIFIASIGLNVNSTAVIIGAMLVSPLMGPIMGFGLGIGINDFELIKKALKNLSIAVVISICVSAFYFFLTPLHEAQSELLARTTPSIWDVFIAIFGGLAGIVGGTRKEKSNVIPGVAIATALMPPLCTAGYGLATGNFYYFLGAFYLFCINSVFICISTYIIVRYLKLPPKAFENKVREVRVKRLILVIVVITVIPSVYLTYNIVTKSIFESNARSFIKNEFNFPNTHVVSKVLKYEKGKKEIDVLLFGQDMSQPTIDSIKAKLVKYHLPDAALSVHQGINAQHQIDFSQIKESILDEISNDEQSKKQHVSIAENNTAPIDSLPDLKNELRVLYPNIVSYSLSREVFKSIDTLKNDTMVLFVGSISKPFHSKDSEQFKSWLKYRIKTDSVSVFFNSPIAPKSTHRRKK